MPPVSNCQRRASEAVRSPGVTGADGCELSSMGVRNSTQIP